MILKLLPALCIAAAMALSACEGWPMRPGDYVPSTPVPSPTPRIETVTPMVLSPTPLTATALTATAESSTPTSTEVTITPTEATASPTTTPTATATPQTGAVAVDILGCDTSIDILHGMGEVTNAYVKISNTTPSDVTDVCATLNGLDEGRPHPDKTKCVPSIPTGFQVILRLTIDTTYRENSPIQVDLASGGNLLLRTGEPACTAIGVFLPGDDELDALTPVP